MLSLSTPVKMMSSHDTERALVMAVDNILFLENINSQIVDEKHQLEKDLNLLKLKYEELYDKMYAPDNYNKEG